MLKLPTRTSRKITRKLILTLIVCACFTFGLVQLAAWFISIAPAKVSFSYAAETCVPGALLPSLHKYKTGSARLKPRGVLSIAGFPVAASRFCIEQLSAPRVNSDENLAIRYFGLPLYEKRVDIKYGPYPSVLAARDTERPVSVLRPLRFSLDSQDQFFSYSLESEDKRTLCTKTADSVVCNLSDLKLKHGTPHEYRLIRSFKNVTLGTASEGVVNIIEPVVLTQSVVGADSVLYQDPDEIVLTSNKVISNDSFPSVTLTKVDSGKSSPIEAPTVTLNEQHIRIKLGAKLERKAKYRLEVDKVAAVDGGALESPYIIEFTTSGGPKVVGINIGSTSVDQGVDLGISFDQALASKDFSGSVRLMSGNTPITFTTWVNGASLVVSPSDYLPFCANISLYIDEKIASAYGVSGDSSFTYNFRTRCYRVGSIGNSVQGRSINAYWFGTGATMLLYIGNMHGGEYSSNHTMDSWIADLDAQFPRIPKELTIVVIPTANPDGYASGSRLNAHGVDLNRNFPTTGSIAWRPDVSPGGGPILPNGGGSAPLSEPESQALANFIGTYRPRLTLSFHSAASYVIANDAGDSHAQGQAYAGLVGYSYFDGTNYEDAFDYAVTGALDDWMAQAYGLSELLVELPSHSGNYYWSNDSALWNTLNTR